MRSGVELGPPSSGAPRIDRRPQERAQVVLARAVARAAPPRYELSAVTLEVLRLAQHDSATLAHALTLGRSRLRRDRTDEAAQRAVRLLERAIEFLGVRPHPDEVGVSA